jgi:hypothetical protein
MGTSVIYKIIYPNGKIYVGQDRTNTLTYFGSPKSAYVAADFTPEQRQRFTVTKEILWSSDTASPAEVTKMEIQFILELRSNDPAVGYNRNPTYKRQQQERE